MKLSSYSRIVLAAATVGNFFLGCHAFTSVTQHQRPSTCLSSEAVPPNNNNNPVNLVSHAAFVRGIDILKADMGMEIIPDEEKPMYAIGKLDANLPIELVSGIRLSDCETVTLISQVRQDVVDATGISSLDTIVAVRVGNDADGNYGYEKIVRETPIQDTAQAYTEAINFAVSNNIPSIELEVNRLVPMMPSQDEE